MNSPKTSTICRRCKQWCCRTEPHQLRADTPEDTLEYYKVRSKDYEKCEDGSWIFYLDQPCQHVSAKGCAIYKDRPGVCSRYPAHWHEAHEKYCELMRIKFND